MKKYLILVCLFYCLVTANVAWCQQRCGAVHVPGARSERDETFNVAVDGGAYLVNRTVITIPVVVHVVWNKQEENISDTQILSQIVVLNKDFRKLNIEVPGIPAVFQNLVADVEIEFCLASSDPQGLPTTGITRTFTNNSVGIGGTPAIHYTSQGGRDAWDTAHYLNIWVAKFAGNIGGIGAFPGEGLPAEDGVEINYRQFGTLNVEPPYDLGRTCTHEIGHYFNLEHPWGPGILDCCKDDFVADTPPACETYINQCPVHPVVSCAGPDLFMDYMFYTDDACMGMFTKGQKARMLATLNTVRSGLVESQGCIAVPTHESFLGTDWVIYPNPVHDYLKVENTSLEGGWAELELFGIAGNRLLSQRFETSKQQSIPVENLPIGIYLLRIKNGQQYFTEKIIKQ
ncbi:MAG: T9SS type A sorting domain-containing protein [Lewinellaceae bacterium]|nr:T9SS type A sorting domain-containing protein [Saprospiraceae bacterium]MCB9340535.1 T9SS type A sorting domain-containing protein [Lewinellaceae bacterium]